LKKETILYKKISLIGRKKKGKERGTDILATKYKGENKHTSDAAT